MSENESKELMSVIDMRAALMAMVLANGGEVEAAFRGYPLLLWLYQNLLTDKAPARDDGVPKRGTTDGGL